MIKLRTILLRRELYISILLITIIISFIRIIIPTNTIIKNTYKGTINNYSIDGNKLTIKINKVQASYYIKTYKEYKKLLKLSVGDQVLIKGDFKYPNKELINIYKSKNIEVIGTIKSIKILNYNYLYIIKNIFRNRLNNNPYLYTFLLGDKSLISSDILYSYQENGISHLFAISGMHISLLSGIILKILKKVQEEKRYFITSLILFLYLLIVGPSPSILRGVLFFILFSINKVYYFNIKNTYLFIFALSISLLYNPFYIYDTGFQYSYTISLSLLLNQKYLQSNSYIKGLFKTSYISFLSSIPISLYHTYSINLLSIIYNLLFVPFVSLIIFPLSLICIIIPYLTSVLNICTNLLENISLFLQQFRSFILVFPKWNITIYLIYVVLIFISYKYKRTIYIFIVILLFHLITPYFISATTITLLDVGQGDSILLYSNHHALLIDTGGITSNDYEEWKKKKHNYSIVKSKTIPYIKSLGINKIETLVLTHGDYDHLGEADNLIKYFKVDQVLINNNKENYYEQKIKNKIIAKEGQIIKCGSITLQQLNTNLKDENDSSLVFYATYKNITMLLTGDASKKTEDSILNNYDLPKINILKVGHHGSKTSTGERLLKVINPDIALISVGKDNKFNHPSIETIEILNKYNVKIYRTDKLGNIKINLNKDFFTSQINVNFW